MVGAILVVTPTSEQKNQCAVSFLIGVLWPSFDSFLTTSAMYPEALTIGQVRKAWESIVGIGHSLIQDFVITAQIDAVRTGLTRARPRTGDAETLVNSLIAEACPGDAGAVVNCLIAEACPAVADTIALLHQSASDEYRGLSYGVKA